MASVSQLTPLLPTTPYLLAYALPLLLLSLLLTFAGTFLTLDRSRSFPPTDAAAASGKGYAAVPGTLAFEKPKKSRLTWMLEGGIGGLAGGYAFGVHLSTALALLIPATTSSASLSPKSFLAIWILSCIISVPVAGRYRYAAFAFFGISGGTLTALALCIITHPSLPSRVILVSICLPLLTLLVLLTSTIPIPRLTTTVFHPILRLCTASTGAFGVVVSVALLMNPKQEGWANAWERLWMKNGPPEGLPWGSGAEQGLSAAYAVFLAGGIAVDWALRRWIGESPDEKWDSYLAHYAANLPNQAGRAGSFQPLTSFWDRFFSSSTPTPPYSKEIIFPNETDLKSKFPLPLPVTMHNMSPGKLSKAERGMELTRVPTSVELLKKKRSKGKRGAAWRTTAESRDRKERKPVRFGDLSDDSDSDDNDDDKTKKPSGSSAAASPNIEQKGLKDAKHTKRPWIVTNAQHSVSSSSTPTLVGNRAVSSDPRLDALDTLDYDQEIAQLKKQRKKADDNEDLVYSDYEEDLTAQRPRGTIEESGWSPAFLKRHQSQNQSDGAMPKPVPATPSLIKAIDRLAVAQKEAYGSAVQAASQKDAAAPTRSASKDHSNSRRPSASPEDAEAGGPKEASAKAERAPRWEEFWREVRVKAQS
ncbi:hypothetical protein GALMADRAFT_58295 [Galerina marginata CBS 339.88]|uniref:DUF4203 domain-containing protein n=1 Tax=Galerina marginata (strain CBS 339.88) TaxID=685588 RepID=A0A067TTW1_GALM3|nr:hypothetical protein GALMADRAFT_58295 [Galerina marginata CBS 339.88]